jgi:hypothetical protein
MEKLDYLQILITDTIVDRGGVIENGKKGPHAVELLVEYHDRRFVITVSEEE